MPQLLVVFTGLIDPENQTNANAMIKI